MTILASLNNYYDRMAAEDGSVPPYGYTKEKISFALVLSTAGEIVEVIDCRDVESLPQKNKRSPPKVVFFPKLMEVPQSRSRTGKKTGDQIITFFLWDNAEYVLGIAKTQNQKTLQKHEAFKKYCRKMLDDPDDEGLQALLSFFDCWEPSKCTELPYAKEMIGTNLVFRFERERRYLHDRDAARVIWDNHIRNDTSNIVQYSHCLITGEHHLPITKVHHSIKGVYGAQSSGGSIVAFNQAAFRSHGKYNSHGKYIEKKQGANAPISLVAASKYTAALNKLLERGSCNRLQVADTSTVFWADTTDVGEAAAKAGEYLIAISLDPKPTDEQEATKIRDLLEMIAKGKPLKEINSHLNEKTRSHVLGLAPNASRLSIRFWQSDRLGHFIEHFRQHWKDLDIEPCPWRTAPSVYRLLLQTASQGKSENIPPLLGGELMRAILTGRRYPRSLLTAVIVRMRADREVNGMRAAIVKACLTRDRRKNHEPEEIPVSLNKDDPNPAYRLGRLFAVLEHAQRSALGKINATIRDRYYAAASATPAAIFPVLLRIAGHHISSLRKGDKGGLAYWFDGQIGEIMNGLGSEMPRHLRIEEQGRFAIGYYHQRYTKKGDADTTTDATATEDQDQ